MIQVLMQWWDGVLRVIETAPPQVWAVLAGTFMSWGVTQRAKFLIPHRLAHCTRHQLSQAIAFALGLAVTWALWRSLPGFIAAVLVGLWSPWSYALFMRWIGRRWPAARARLSQDVRP